MWDMSTSYIILVSVFTGVTQRTISWILCTDLRRGVFVFFFPRRERWQQWVQSPSNMRKQLAIKLRRLASLNSRDTYETYEQMQNILTLFVTAEMRRVDENNIVEMQTNYSSYQKIPLYWFHLPKREVTKRFKNLRASALKRLSLFLKSWRL